MSFTDALARIGQIQTQIQSLSSAFVPPATKSQSTTTAPSAVPSTGGASITGSGSFASALAQAQAPTAASTGVPSTSTGVQSGLLTSGQQQFASRLAADTGLDPHVISAWLLAEESGGAATSRQSAGNNDWLNIGYTDSGTYGSADPIWSDPLTAADATAGWLKGQNTIPGYGTASSGIQAILATAGQPPAAQIAALQQSGWASSGYPDLPSLYSQVGGA